MEARQIFNKNKTQILGVVGEFDTSKGKITEEFIEIKHPAVKGVERKSHFEIVKVYENGGKDVVEVVDVEGVEARDEYVEKIPVLIYEPYTEDELQKIEKTKIDEETKNKNWNDIVEFLKTISVDELKKLFK